MSDVSHGHPFHCSEANPEAARETVEVVKSCGGQNKRPKKNTKKLHQFCWCLLTVGGFDDDFYQQLCGILVFSSTFGINSLECQFVNIVYLSIVFDLRISDMPNVCITLENNLRHQAVLPVFQSHKPWRARGGAKQVRKESG